jgi:hypothetical protein
MKPVSMALLAVLFLLSLTNDVLAQKVELTWSPNPESDLEQYVLYRAVSSPDAEEVEIASVPATETAYQDRDIFVGEVYYYRIVAQDSAGSLSEPSEQIKVYTSTPTDTDASPAALPEKFDLLQNYPNPFNPETTIQYTLPLATHVRLDVTNMRGQVIRSLVNDEKQPGTYRVVWDARTETGVRAASGVYVYRIEASEFRKSMRLILLK